MGRYSRRVSVDQINRCGRADSRRAAAREYERRRRDPGQHRQPDPRAALSRHHRCAADCRPEAAVALLLSDHQAQLSFVAGMGHVHPDDLRRARDGLACQRVVRRIGFRRAHRDDGGFCGRIRVLLRLSVRAGQGARFVAEPGFHLASAGAGADRRRGVDDCRRGSDERRTHHYPCDRAHPGRGAGGRPGDDTDRAHPARDERGIPARRRSNLARRAQLSLLGWRSRYRNDRSVDSARCRDAHGRPMRWRRERRSSLWWDFGLSRIFG